MGFHTTRNRKAHELKLDQHLYAESMVKSFDVKKATEIPAASGVPTLSKADELRNPEKEEMRKSPHREAVGSLMWTATMTRSGIACTVRAVARFCENPRPAHKKAVMEDFAVSPSHERMGDYVRWTGLWTLHASKHGLGFRSLHGYETIGFGCGVNAG